MLRRFFKNKSGATAIEYGLIAALIAVATIASLRELGDGISFVFEKVRQELTEPDGTFGTGTAGVGTGNRLVGATAIANANIFEPHKLIDGLNSQEELFKWIDTNNGSFPVDGLINPTRISNFLSDMSTIYGSDMSQDLSSYGNFVDNSEFNQIMDNLNDTRRAL